MAQPPTPLAAQDVGVPAAGDVAWAALSHLPVHVLRGADLDELELRLGGSLQPRMVVAVPPPLAAAVTAAGGVLLADPETTPLGHLELAEVLPSAPDGAGLVRLAGPVGPVRPPAHGPFRALRRSADDVRRLLAGRGVPTVAYAFRDVPTAADLDRIRTTLAREKTAPLLVAVVGAGAPRGVDAAGLVRAVTAAAHDVGAVPPATGLDVLALPLPDRAWEAADEVLARHGVAAAVRPELRREAAELTALAAVAAGGDIPAGLLPAASALAIRRARAQRRGAVVLLSGLSGSGKSTIARALAEALDEHSDRTVTLLDGDEVRQMLSAGLGFSRPDRELNVRRIGYVAALVARHGGIAIAAPIAPYGQVRQAVRAMAEEVGEFVLVHVSTPMAVCEARDRKGLYAKARAGLIPEFTGISDPYEEPADADLVLDASVVPVAEAVATIVAHLERRGLLSNDGPTTPVG